MEATGRLEVVQIIVIAVHGTATVELDLRTVLASAHPKINFILVFNVLHLSSRLLSSFSPSFPPSWPDWAIWQSMASTCWPFSGLVSLIVFSLARASWSSTWGDLIVPGSLNDGTWLRMLCFMFSICSIFSCCLARWSPPPPP